MWPTGCARAAAVAGLVQPISMLLGSADCTLAGHTGLVKAVGTHLLIQDMVLWPRHRYAS